VMDVSERVDIGPSDLYINGAVAHVVDLHVTDNNL
jgi:hypothetical protein